MADLLWDRGYAATSPRDVMAKAHVGQGSFYHHFSGKHDLAISALRQNIFEGLTEAPEDAGSPAVDRIEARLARPRPGTRGCRIGRMTSDPAVVEDPEMLSIIADAFSTMRQRWATLTAEAIDAGNLPGDLDPDDLAQTFSAVIQGGYVLARAHGSQEPMDAAIRGLIALMESVRTSGNHPIRRAPTQTTPQSKEHS